MTSGVRSGKHDDLDGRGLVGLSIEGVCLLSEPELQSSGCLTLLTMKAEQVLSNKRWQNKLHKM